MIYSPKRVANMHPRVGCMDAVSALFGTGRWIAPPRSCAPRCQRSVPLWYRGTLISVAWRSTEERPSCVPLYSLCVLLYTLRYPSFNVGCTNPKSYSVTGQKRSGKCLSKRECNIHAPANHLVYGHSFFLMLSST